MKARNTLASLAVVSAIAGTTFVGANMVSAAGNGESLITRIAERFNLEESDVEAVFEEHRQERQSGRSEAHREHLSSLVDEGILTEEQKAELESIHEQRRQTIDSIRTDGLNREEMHDAMSGLRDEVEAWAESNGIDLDALRSSEDNGPMKRGQHAKFRHSGEARN